LARTHSGTLLLAPPHTPGLELSGIGSLAPTDTPLLALTGIVVLEHSGTAVLELSGIQLLELCCIPGSVPVGIAVLVHFGIVALAQWCIPHLALSYTLAWAHSGTVASVPAYTSPEEPLGTFALALVCIFPLELVGTSAFGQECTPH